MEKILPIILCGGSGARLWPLSRASFPKQFLEVNSFEDISFFQKTLKRLEDFENVSNPMVICNEEHRFIVAEQMRDIKIKAKSILLEPVGRNTAPAISVAALKAIENGENPLLLILPSDHLIKDVNKFKKVVEAACHFCEKGELITFGIKPNKPETGYGYIEALNVLNDDYKGERIARFIEKPNFKKAKEFISNKKFLWNSGIFLFKANMLLDEVKKRSPKMYNYCQKSLSKNLLDLDFQRLEKKSFSLCENISIDKAIMEKTEKGIVFPLDVGWCDIGSWKSMWDVSDKDSDGNVFSGKVFKDNVKNSYLRSNDRIIVGIGLEDLIVVETIDAVLVANKNQTQNVKHLVSQLISKGESEANTHKTIFRPWGNYTSIANGSNWQVKKIIVNPEQSLSLQMHKFRAEHWIVVNGKALVEIDKKEKILENNESTFIPMCSKHRLTNIGKIPLILIEVQSGNYLGEDDIIRFEDNYGRANN